MKYVTPFPRVQADIFFPPTQRPYFIVSPSYTHQSSGVRTLHLLCHSLNAYGSKAFLVSSSGEHFITHPEYNTPVLTREQRFFYEQHGPAPIVIYPDIVKGNPLQAKHVVRYLMAPRGAYGGDSEFPETDDVWGGLPSLAAKVLRVPVSDTSIFYKLNTDKIRLGACFYSYKYDQVHGNALLDLTKDATRLKGTLYEIAEVLRTSSVCYLYEMSSIMTEASLCGTPVVLVRTPYFSSVDPECMGANICWSDNGDLVRQAEDYELEYERERNNYLYALRNFIRDTQEFADDQ